MKQFGIFAAALLLFASIAAAAPAFEVGDCVIFREGGAGLLLKSPSYWLRGSVVAIAQERRLAAHCPDIGKPPSGYTHEDWVRLAAAAPCVESDADVRIVDVLRIRVAIEDWETPWSYQHGTAAWLFRGQFLDQRLHKGGLVDFDANWLQACRANP
jgi:hypothetical protein